MNQPVVVFDGVCNLCNGTVDFLLRNDITNQLLFTPFQMEGGSGVGSRLLAQFGVYDAPVSVYVIYQNRLYSESDAILFLCSYLRRPWRWFRITRIVPKPLRNLIYRFIARNRYKWFGIKDFCRLPIPEEQSRFL